MLAPLKQNINIFDMYVYTRSGTINRIREIAYGFGGPNEKNVSPH